MSGNNSGAESEAKEKVFVTMNAETLEWLREEFPEADSDPERVRAAIGDSRRFWDRIDLSNR